MTNQRTCTSPVMISVLTPTWNRSKYLSKVCAALKAQTFQEFEWIVANDGSTDDTEPNIRSLATSCAFPITLINASTHIGKARMDNEAVRAASGQFIIWCDSDDWLLPNALETLVNTWQSIPKSDVRSFSGITALCETKEGILGSGFPSSPHTDIVLNKLYTKVACDMVLFFRADLLKHTPFPEVDYLIPESSVWHVLGVYKTRFVPIPLVRKNYRSEHCVSYSGLMEYSRGRAYAFAKSRPYVASLLDIRQRSWRLITYLRCCVHGEVSIREAISLWGGGVQTWAKFFLASPPALALALKDALQGKVRKTHKNFNAAAKSVRLCMHRVR